MSVRPLAFLLPFLPAVAPAQSTTTACTGLCLQQVQCPNNGSTTITGTVYAPNGTDPIPNVTVYVPNAAVATFQDGISCPVPGALPSGSPLVGTYSNFDGTFSLANVPVGANIPLVIVAGKWRRQVTVPVTTACTNTPMNVRFAKNQSEGDIPKFAVVTGNADQVECVLRKVGLDDTEFTNLNGTGRIQLVQAGGAPGALIDSSTKTQADLMADASVLNAYDVLMLPCEGSAYNEPSAQLANLITYANAGGRIYASHFAYEWMYKNPPFDTVAQWSGRSTSLADGPATVNQGFGSGATLAKWLQFVGASTTLGQITVQTTKSDVSAINSPTRIWLTLNSSSNPMQFTWDAPVNSTTQQCGRVLFNEYHVENTGNSRGKAFPSECASAGTSMTPQEKLLEYSLFDLSNNGGPATMTPDSADFGNQVVGFTTAPKAFTVTNNSVFSSSLSSATTTGDFLVTSNNCTNVASGSSCTVDVAFKPTALGARTGALAVAFGGTSLSATLTGTGVPAFATSVSSLDFGSVDVGASKTQSVTLTNQSPGALDMPALTLTGDYKASTTCPASIPAGASCNINITFAPITAGARAGSMVTPNGTTTTLTGNGIDFALKFTPVSDTVVAGLSKIPTLTATPLAGFTAPITLSCITTAPAATCTITSTTLGLSAETSTTVTIKTASEYTLAGYGTNGLLSGLALFATGALVFARHRKSHAATGVTLALVTLAIATTGLSGCSGKIPSLNATYTPAGTYAVTVTGTDGIVSRFATYTLVVKSK